MQTDDVTVRVQALDAAWETLGGERAVRVVPESLAVSANDWGSDRASFELRRDPGMLWPDLQAFTPVEVEIGGVLVWSGRVSETPARDGDDPVIGVQCEGWQYHLDDDVYAKSYVHTRLGDWRDLRTDPVLSLASYPPRLHVNTAQDGAITIGALNGTVWPGSTGVGVILDLGPFSTAKRVIVTARRGAGAEANTRLYIRGSNNADPINGGASEDGTFGSLLATGVATSATAYAQTFTTPRRYVSIFLFNGTGYTAGADDIVLISAIQVFSDTAHESGNASVLKASQVIADARLQATAKLSSDVSRIATTTFSIPDLHFEREPRTPREVIQGVNAFHNYLTQVDVDKRLVFAARPTAPLFEVGTWGGSVFEDSSMNAGQDIHNRALITGTGPDGAPLLVERLPAFTPGPMVPVATPAFPTLTVDGPGTGTSDSARIDATIGVFLAGRTYRIHFHASASGETLSSASMEVGTATDNRTISLSLGRSQQYWIEWTPTTDAAATSVRLIFRVQSSSGFIQATLSTPGSHPVTRDAANVSTAAATIVDRQQFTRTKILPISAALTTSVAQQIGDTYLAAHRTQPLKGSITATTTGIRHHQHDGPLHPSELLRHPGQLVRLTHRTDPDNGALGRDGTIASVSYTHDTRTVSITLDNDRRNFEALLSRFALLSPA